MTAQQRADVAGRRQVAVEGLGGRALRAEAPDQAGQRTQMARRERRLSGSQIGTERAVEHREQQGAQHVEGRGAVGGRRGRGRFG
jgi:hypothetical protein